jgi:hypothetical protein
VTSIFKTQLFANRSKWCPNILQTDICSPIILEKIRRKTMLLGTIFNLSNKFFTPIWGAPQAFCTI